MAKRRIILPDDVKDLLTMASELKQMRAQAVDHDRRIETLETQPKAVEAPTVMPIIASHSLLPKEPRPLPKDAAKQRKRPLLPIEMSRSLLPQEPSPKLQVQ